MTEIPYPSTGILARLNLHIQGQLNYTDTDGMNIEQLVDLTEELPNFCWGEIWRDLHRGNNLDRERQVWLIKRIQLHGHSHLEAQAMRLYKIVKKLLSEYD